MLIRQKFLLILFFCNAYASDITLSVRAQKHTRMPIALIVAPEQELDDIATIVAKDLSWTKQFAPEVMHHAPIKRTKDVRQFAQQNKPIVVFLSQPDKADYIEWRVYDSAQARMLKGKRTYKDDSSLRQWAHRCSNGIWTALTGMPGIFDMTIAYCQEFRQPGRRPQKHIYVAEYDGSHAHALVATPTVNIAPRWRQANNGDPVIYYSECTLRNVRLMATNMKGKKRIISDFDGLNMLVAFAPDGKRAVLCLSRDGGTQLYLYKVGKKGLKQLTHQGAHISPCFVDKHNIIFCSDNNKRRRPYICTMNIDTGDIQEVITGYCSSPVYSPASGLIAYAKMVDGQMQLFTYDMKKKIERQLTFGYGSKDECCWSPCGTYLIYTFEDGGLSRIAIINAKTGASRFVTSAKKRCTYPAW